MNESQFKEQLDEIIEVATTILQAEGAEREVFILSNSKCELSNGFSIDKTYYCLIIRIPFDVYKKEKRDMKLIKHKILRAVSLLANEKMHEINSVHFIPTMSMTDDTPELKISLNNQGRVRSDRIAPLEHDGLLFRSEPEINLYKALKSLGVVFAPLPVFLQGGEIYKRIEPDFLIIKNGCMTLVEVDGYSTHHESPADAYERTYLLEKEGVRVIRIKASECLSDTEALQKAKDILSRINCLRGHL